MNWACIWCELSSNLTHIWARFEKSFENQTKDFWELGVFWQAIFVFTKSAMVDYYWLKIMDYWRSNYSSFNWRMYKSQQIYKMEKQTNRNATNNIYTESAEPLKKLNQFIPQAAKTIWVHRYIDDNNANCMSLYRSMKVH